MKSVNEEVSQEEIAKWCEEIEATNIPMGRNLLVKGEGKMNEKGIILLKDRSAYTSQISKFEVVSLGEEVPESFPKKGSKVGVHVDSQNYFEGRLAAEKKFGSVLIKYFIMHCTEPLLWFKERKEA